jgi:hypothetical protein
VSATLKAGGSRLPMSTAHCSRLMTLAPTFTVHWRRVDCQERL